MTKDPITVLREDLERLIYEWEQERVTAENVCFKVRESLAARATAPKAIQPSEHDEPTHANHPGHHDGYTCEAIAGAFATIIGTQRTDLRDKVIADAQAKAAIQPAGEAAQQNMELVIARLDQIIEAAETADCDLMEELAKEALPCARAVLASSDTAPVSAPVPEAKAEQVGVLSLEKERARFNAWLESSDPESKPTLFNAWMAGSRPAAPAFKHGGFMPRHIQDKHCFVPCPPERCNCRIGNPIEWAMQQKKMKPAVTQETSKLPEAVQLLAAVFDAWENGDDCYENGDVDGSYMGRCLQLDDDVFNRCVDLLDRTNTPRNAAPAIKHEATFYDVESMREQSIAWLSVCEVLNEISPGWQESCGTGIDAATAAIRKFAAPVIECKASPLKGGQIGRPMKEQLARCEAAVAWANKKQEASELPPLPEKVHLGFDYSIGADLYGHTADQMRDYGQACADQAQYEQGEAERAVIYWRAKARQSAPIAVQGSIGDDEAFVKLLHSWFFKAEKCEWDSVDAVTALVAYIDARSPVPANAGPSTTVAKSGDK